MPQSPKPSGRKGGRRAAPRRSAAPIILFILMLALIAGAAFWFLGRPAAEVPSATPTPSPSAEATPAPEPTPTPAPTPDPDEEWLLRLVNPWTTMPDGYVPPKLTDLSEDIATPGQKVDSRMYDPLLEMLAACKADGKTAVVVSSYRTQKKQQSLFDNKVQRLINSGLSSEDAYVEASTVVALPGTSEHQLGLAVDLVDIHNYNLDESQEKTEAQQWLMAHSWEYGFILRYPNDKSETTGIIYEPWHYRYVGKEAAREIYEQGICLEEYLENR